MPASKSPISPARCADFRADACGLRELTAALNLPARPDEAALRRGSSRLLRAVEALPLRYSPFQSRLAALWRLSESAVARELARAAESRRWRRSLWPGVRTFELACNGRRDGQQARLIHFEPGVRFPRHRHRGSEHVLVLEGSYADGSGDVVAAGDGRMMPAGSEHELSVIGDRACVAAVAEQGIEITEPWWRLLRKLW